MEIKYFDIDGFDLVTGKEIKGLKTDTQNIIRIEREVLPIIFIPGVMASRLRNRAGKKAWDPDSIRFMVRKYGFITVTARKRKQLVIGKEFDAEYLQVINEDEEQRKKYLNAADKDREKRGWSGIFWETYGPFIEFLQDYKWSEAVYLCYELPVHAFGYNWTASNADSGKKLKEYIDQVISDYKNMDRKCEKVILVTHSMGGLVARAACKLHGAEGNVLGVLHGVQPAAGAATGYWRMKGGFERPGSGPYKNVWDWFRNPIKMLKYKVAGYAAAWILGTDGEEVTSILANSPGCLELLPTKNYKPNGNNGSSAWLHVPKRDGMIMSLPKNGDPYEEIYSLNKDIYDRALFWRLVKPEWLDPVDVKASSKPGTNSAFELNDAWSLYIEALKQAKEFHDNLGLDCHPSTYQFYSTDRDTVDRIEFSRETGWRYNPEVSPHATSRGKYIAYVDKYDQEVDTPKDDQVYDRVQMALPKNWKGGDGTVADSSGAILKPDESTGGTAKISIHNSDDWFNNEHQDIYATERARNLSIVAIENFAKSRIRELTGKK